MTREELLKVAKPILFNTEMTKAILDGRKSVTRRLIKFPEETTGRLPESGATDYIYYPGGIKRPLYQVGDILIPAMKVKGYDCKYCADLQGNIWSKASGEYKRLKSSITSNYKRLALRKGGKDVNRTVHKVVCETYYGKQPFDKAVVRHLDGDNLNNQPYNLDWGTYKQNWDDKKHIGNGIREKHHNAKITMEIAREMRKSGKTYQQLAIEYGLNTKTVQRILNNETWKENYPKIPPNIKRWMPKELARIFLKVTDVRVERLQDITEIQAENEGITCKSSSFRETLTLLRNINLPHAVSRFSVAWDETVSKKDFKRYGWESNPFVWVIEFERVVPE